MSGSSCDDIDVDDDSNGGSNSNGSEVEGSNSKDDSVGDDTINQRLSLERVQAVASVLQLGGVSRNNMELISLGEADPRADNATAAGREQNRRVVINITPRIPASSVALAP